MLLYDKTHVAYGGEFQSDIASEVASEPLKVLINNTPVLAFVVVIWERGNKCEKTMLLLNENRVWSTAKVDFKTMTVLQRVPVRLNRVGIHGESTHDSGIRVCSLVRAAVNKHGWGVKTLFEKLNSTNAVYVSSLWTIEELVKEIKQITPETANFQIQEDN